MGHSLVEHANIIALTAALSQERANIQNQLQHNPLPLMINSWPNLWETTPLQMPSTLLSTTMSYGRMEGYMVSGSAPGVEPLTKTYAQ